MGKRKGCKGTRTSKIRENSGETGIKNILTGTGHGPEVLYGGHSPQTELAMMVEIASLMDSTTDLEHHIQINKNNRNFDINQRDSVGMTALQVATSFGQLDIVKLLVRYGADVNIKDDFGFTPLFSATGRYPNVTIATYLIEEANASITSTNNMGATALHGSAFDANIDCLRLLLKHGADPLQKDDCGKTPLDLADDSVAKSIIDNYLQQKQAKAERAEKDKMCELCRSPGKEGEKLKQCANCRGVWYCSRACQARHWREGHKIRCIDQSKYIVVSPASLDSLVEGFSLMVYMQKMTFNDQFDEDSPLGNKAKSGLFPVKVMVPMVSGPEPMFVFNMDRTVCGYIMSADPEYHKLRKLIEKSQWTPTGGYKMFFWAEMVTDSDEAFKVFYGRPAPSQQW